MLYNWILALIILQVILLLLSPRFRRFLVFKTYYKTIYQPLFKDYSKYKWKYYLVPTLYLVLYLYMIYLYYYTVLPMIQGRLYSIEDLLVLPVMLVITLFTGIMAMLVQPDSSSNYQSKSYKFDKILFHPNTICRTCKIEKPARSKHCNICNRCIMVSDHHCVWLNNCIGKGNYIFFYSFLIANCIVTSYGFLRLLYILWNHTILISSKQILTLLILTGTFSIICVTFTYMQLSLMVDGMTTNEKDKWFTIQEFMREGKLVNIRSPQGEYSWFILDPDMDSLMVGAPEARYYSTNAYDHTIYTLQKVHKVLSEEEIPNIYDLGSFWKNIQNICN